MFASQSCNRAGRAGAFWLIIFLAGFTWPALSQTTILHLKNGDRLSGELVGDQSDQVVITNAILGKVTVRRGEIDRIETKPAPAVASTNQPVITLTGPQEKRMAELLDLYRLNKISPEEYHSQRAKLLADADRAIPGTNLVELKPGLAEPPAGKGAPATAAAPAPTKPKGPKHWTVDAQLGLDLSISEKDRQLFTGRLKVIYANQPLRNTLDYFFTYGRTEGDVSANRMDGSMKTDYDLSKQLYVYNLGGAGYDEVRKIDLRYEEGPGAGLFLLRGSNYVLRAEYGINYQAQFNIDGTMNERFYHRYAEDFTWKPGPKFSLDEKFEFFPTWGNWGNYRFRFEANLRYWFATHLSFVLTLLDLYDTDPPAGVSKNDLQVRSSIGVKF